MGEILEKGLLIGFGLSIAIFFLTMMNPFLTLIFSGNPSPLDQHDTLVLTLEYGLNYIPEEEPSELHIDMTLGFNISLLLESTEHNLYLKISSPLKSTRLSSSRLLILKNSSVSGNFEIEFSYSAQIITLTFWGK